MYRTRGQTDTDSFGRALATALRPGDCVLLVGDLGAGKSVLARGVAAALGVEGPMPSPTYTLLIPYASRVPVHHFDLYRLADAEEFYGAGLDESLGGEAVSLVEWPIDGVDYSPALRLTLARGAADDERLIALDAAGFGARAADVRAALNAWEAEA